MGDFLIILFDSKTDVIARDNFRDSNEGLLLAAHESVVDNKTTSSTIRLIVHNSCTNMFFYFILYNILVNQ